METRLGEIQSGEGEVLALLIGASKFGSVTCTLYGISRDAHNVNRNVVIDDKSNQDNETDRPRPSYEVQCLIGIS